MGCGRTPYAEQDMRVRVEMQKTTVKIMIDARTVNPFPPVRAHPDELLDFVPISLHIPAMKLQPIQEPFLIEHFDTIGRDGIDRFVLARGRYRAVALNGTFLVNQMRQNHELGILETLILGHAYLAAALMASSLKGAERLSLDVHCDGPVGGLHVEGGAVGTVRGYLFQPNIPIETPLESFDTAPWFGDGTVSVTRYLDRKMTPYTGRIELLHGNLAQDLTRYYAVSEQTPTAIALSVKFNREGLVVGAGGLLIQALPHEEADEPQETIAARLEELVHGLPSLGELFSRGVTSTELVREHFGVLDPAFVGSRPVGFYCDCNRERFMRFIAALPDEDLAEVREKGPFPLRVTCHNCATSYFFEKDEIVDLSA